MMGNKKSLPVAIVGTGPAALMAAENLSELGHLVTVFEKRKGPGWKLLVAGSTGFNISNALPPKQFIEQYRGGSRHFWEKCIQSFSVNDWLYFIESKLKLKTFLGSSGHYFVEGMRASGLLRAWIQRLTDKGVNFHYERELLDFENISGGVRLHFQGEAFDFAAACFALGGGSWEKSPPNWVPLFGEKGIGVEPWRASNVGYRVNWPTAFLKEAEGLPLKNVLLSSSHRSRQGDVVITRYGIEGMPVYHVAERGNVCFDLEVNLSEEEILKRCESVKENLSPLRRVFKKLSLTPAARALLFHCAPQQSKDDLSKLVSLIKRFPIELLGPQPLSEAISSAGGVRFDETTETLMIKKYPGIFAAGEMLDWDVSTGGFLIQACVSQGFFVGKGIDTFLAGLP